MRVLSLPRLIGWAGLVGAGLSGIVAGLLFLGPMLGFYDFGSHDPGPRTTGSVDLPAALIRDVANERPAALQGLGAPIGTITFGSGAVTKIAPAPSTFTPTANGGGARRAPVVPISGTAAPRPSRGSTTPAVPAAPVATPAAPVATPAPTQVAAVAPTPAVTVARPQGQSQSKGKDANSNSFTADSSNRGEPAISASDVADDRKAVREAAKAERNAAKDERRAERDAPPVVEGDAQQDGSVWEHGSDDHDHDHGRGNDHHSEHGGKDKRD